MFIGIVCLIVFLFTTYQLAKDDFIFLRKNVALETIFNIIFLGLPIALLCSRLGYVFLHPDIHYFFNPLVFFIVPYFPGLSLLGGVIGSWIFVALYTKRKKLPTGRILDTFGIAFLMSFSIGIFLQGLILLFSSRIAAAEEIGRAAIGLACVIGIFMQSIKATWNEGAIAYVAVCMYGVLAFLSVGFMLLSKQHVSLVSLITTAIFFFLSLVLFIKSLKHK